MKHINKLPIIVVVAIMVGFLVASAGTKITYTCTPIEGAAGCSSFEKAIMHPSDLVNNKQDSLVKFSTTFVITSVTTFVLLGAQKLSSRKKLRTSKSSAKPKA